ncbi:MAG: hypothetical protein NOM71_03055 [Archaeoglobi archaeon]|nr:hypothetical protein [Archaeoglobi archaeon]
MVKMVAKSFKGNEMGLSAIVGVVLVLAVTVIAGLGLYLWWNSMQTTTQSTIGEQTRAQVRQMATEHATMIVTIPTSSKGYDKKYDFEFTSGWFDWDNNKYIYVTPARYIGRDAPCQNCYRDERFIMEIPVIIKNPNSFDLTNVKLVVDTENQLFYVLHFKKSDGKYQLLYGNGTEFKGILGKYYNAEGAEGDYYTYYWGESGSYAVNLSKSSFNYTAPQGNRNNLDQRDMNFTEYQDWSNKSSFIWMDNNVVPLALLDETNTYIYPYACKGGDCSCSNPQNCNKYALATWNMFFSTGPMVTSLEFCKEKFHNPVYNIGTIKAGETVKTSVYVLFMRLDLSQSQEWEIKLNIYSDEGVKASIPVKFYASDPGWT